MAKKRNQRRKMWRNGMAIIEQSISVSEI